MPKRSKRYRIEKIMRENKSLLGTIRDVWTIPLQGMAIAVAGVARTHMVLFSHDVPLPQVLPYLIRHPHGVNYSSLYYFPGLMTTGL